MLPWRWASMMFVLIHDEPRTKDKDRKWCCCWPKIQNPTTSFKLLEDFVFSIFDDFLSRFRASLFSFKKQKKKQRKWLVHIHYYPPSFGVRVICKGRYLRCRRYDTSHVFELGLGVSFRDNFDWIHRHARRLYTWRMCAIGDSSKAKKTTE